MELETHTKLRETDATKKRNTRLLQIISTPDGDLVVADLPDASAFRLIFCLMRGASQFLLTKSTAR
jgi:hypothetical protein